MNEQRRRSCRRRQPTPQRQPTDSKTAGGSSLPVDQARLRCRRIRGTNGCRGARVFEIEDRTAAAHTALLKEANRAHAELVNRFVQRYEMRQVECKVEFDTPEPGYKSFVRLDNDESIREVRMTEAEKQRAFVFDAGDGKPQ
jgi:hypothetical protein